MCRRASRYLQVLPDASQERRYHRQPWAFRRPTHLEFALRMAGSKRSSATPCSIFRYRVRFVHTKESLTRIVGTTIYRNPTMNRDDIAPFLPLSNAARYILLSIAHSLVMNTASFRRLQSSPMNNTKSGRPLFTTILKGRWETVWCRRRTRRTPERIHRSGCMS